MKCVVLCLFALVGVALARTGHYTDRYDNVNLDEILSNDRLLDPYMKCLTDVGRCTPEGKELKSHIIEALETDCAKCTAAQRSGTDRVIGHLIKYKESYWNQLKAKYDPTGKYSKKHEAKVASYKA